jgi:SSS family solute:Na+ symporter
MAASYVVGPLLWNYAHRHGLHNITDIVSHRFGAPWLGALLTVAATVFLLPYIQLQITGTGTVVASVSYGAIGLGVAYLVAFVVSEVFILAGGLRGSAWVSVLKDVTVVVTLAVVFVYVPLRFFGGYGGLFARVASERTDWLTMPGPNSATYGLAWFISTALLNGAVYSVLPTTVAGFLGARSAQTLRRNAVILPVYQVLLFVPMAVFMLVIGTMWGRSVFSLHHRTASRPRQLSQVVTLVAGGLALGMTYLFPNALVRLSVISYEGLAQLLPLVVIALVWRRMSLVGGVAGMTVGILVVVVLMVTGNDPWNGINAGALALAVNLALTGVVSLARPGDAPPDRLAVSELAEPEPVAAR